MLLYAGILCSLLTGTFLYSNPSQTNEIELDLCIEDEDDYGDTAEDLAILEAEDEYE